MTTRSTRITPSFPALLLALAASALAPTHAQALSGSQTPGPWTFRTHVVLTGSSDVASSEPEGYKVYSAFTLDAAVQRTIGSQFALELGLRTESREVTLAESGSAELPLGSVEALPVNLVFQFRPDIGDKIRPYVGAGLNLTVVWEKAGALDSTDLSPSLAPVVQAGADVRLTPRVVFNVDVKWNPWRTDLEDDGVTVAHLRVDPLALGIGVGFRF
jgi:outer membrane protein W